MSEPSLPVFVYGTLRSDGAQAGLLPEGPRRRARVRGALWALPAGYPALVPGSDGWVEGELVPDPGARRLALLDRYEGVDEGLYRRVILEVSASLQVVRAWAWVMDDPELRGGTRVRSGRWRTSRRR